MSDREDRGGALVFTSLADRQLVPTGTALLEREYKIFDLHNPSQWTLNDLQWLGDRAIQMDVLEALAPEIKAKLVKVIRGQVSWNKIQAEVISEAFKGASDTEKAKINALISESKFGSIVQQQAHRLQAAKNLHGQETTEINNYENALCGFILQALRERHQQAIAQKEAQAGDPQYAAELADWEQNRQNLIEMAKASIEYGSAARSHPKFKRQQERALGGGQSDSWSGTGNWGGRPVDRLEFKLEGNAAGAIARAAGAVKRGASRVFNLFR